VEQAEVLGVADQRRHAVVPQAAGVDGVRDEPLAERVHLHQWREPGDVAVVVPELALGQGRARGGFDGHDPGVGSGEVLSDEREREPGQVGAPPAQPKTNSGASSPNISSCLSVSSPMMVWCRHTWLSTEPSEYRVPASAAATSTASDTAMPSEPGVSGSLARKLRPASVRV